MSERERVGGEKRKAPTTGSRVEAEFFTQLAIRGDVQQVHRPMPEEVRLQYEDVVTKPLDIAANIFAS
jgi:hypothetical protein